MNAVVVKEEVAEALDRQQAVLALESTIITHGLPWPQNLKVAIELEERALALGVVPATIAVVAGQVKVGLRRDEIEALAQQGPACLKLSSFDLPWAQVHQLWGSTTVAGTMQAAALAGIKVFATGGIGGVHRKSQQLPDISHDLEMLSRLSMVVVSAGAKAILDLAATVEYLETKGILTVGYGCDEFPAFYYRNSGLRLPYQTSQVEVLAELFTYVQRGSLLVANPVPAAEALDKAEIEGCITKALAEAERQGVRGKALTPFLLSALEQHTGGRSVACNLALVRNNVELACRIAKVMQAGKTVL